MTLDDIVGTWRLMTYEFVGTDGSVAYPMGESVTGRLTYTPDGYMHALLMPGDRADFPSNDVFTNSDEELLRASHRLVAYCGRVEIDGDTIYHNTEVSFFPNWVGQSLKRLAKLEGNILTLTSHTAPRAGREGQGRLVWERT